MASHTDENETYPRSQTEKKRWKKKNIDPKTRILVLYTGGTIGMKYNSGGVLAPASNSLIEELKKMPMFYDKEYAQKHLEGHDCVLSMPLSKEGKRIIYEIEEYNPLLDSSNMAMEEWSRIAMDIFATYETVDAFVVLHGTDTMAYTASALSFMCENLGKPVILTGSQIPIFEIRSDGRDNFLAALIIAGNYCIPEVMICFSNQVFRGNRCLKQDSGSFEAFNSPNLPPLVTLEISITVDWASVFRRSTPVKFMVHTYMCPNVGILKLFPGITSKTVREFMQPPMQGVVLQTFGAGNAPDNCPDLIEVFTQASERNVLIVNISQCTRGYVDPDPSYATGKVLLDSGIMPGGDMTPEAALTKLSYVLGKYNWTIAKKRKMLQINLRGEMKDED